MKATKRDGVLISNGLSAEFRYVRDHSTVANVVRIQTAAGELWADTSELHYDVFPSPRPQTPNSIQTLNEKLTGAG